MTDFVASLRRLGFNADQVADIMRYVHARERGRFLHNFEVLVSLPLPFDQAARAAIWSVQDDWAAVTDNLAGFPARSRRAALIGQAAPRSGRCLCHSHHSSWSLPAAKSAPRPRFTNPRLQFRSRQPAQMARGALAGPFRHLRVG
jgi:hypothetical protein